MMTTLEITKIQHEIIELINEICNWTKAMFISPESDLYHDVLMDKEDIRELLLELEIKYNIIIPDEYDLLVETVSDIETIIGILKGKRGK